MVQPKLAMNIPSEHPATVLVAGSATWTSSNRVHTTSLARIFFDQLGVTMLIRSFSYRRDALLFGIMLNWGREIHLFDLTAEQLAAAFALAQQLLVHLQPPAASAPMATDGHQENIDALEPVPEKPRYDDLSLKNAKTIRKRTGARRWTQSWQKPWRGT